MRPAVGSSKPPIIRSVVVLPQPEGPSRAKNFPRSISSEMSSTATTSSKRLVRCSSRTSATAAGVAITVSLALITSRLGGSDDTRWARRDRRGEGPPRLSAAAAPDVAVSRFGVAGARARDLGSERDRTVGLDDADGAPLAVLKVSNSSEDPAVLDMEAAAALHVNMVDSGLRVALPW